jgi:DNA-binding NarL/FixJ family response regulator
MVFPAKRIRQAVAPAEGSPKASRPVAVCLIEENPLAEEFLRLLLAKDPSIHTESFSTLSQEKDAQSARVFVVDICGLALPIGEYLRQLRVRFPQSRYLVVGPPQADEDLVRILWFGIHGYVEHAEVAESLLAAIHAVSQGRIWLRRQALAEYIENIASWRAHRSPVPESLTPREYQITELVKRRFSNKEIAAMLGVRESTVKFHLSNIFLKLQINNRQDLVRERKSGSASGRWWFALNTAQK